MKILVTGASGFIGSALVSFLSQEGHEVIRIVRTQSNDNKKEIIWDPYSGKITKSRLEKADAVIHLSGENIDSRWTEAKKVKIRDSRVKTTYFLSKTLAALQHPPGLLITASGISYYGDRDNEILNESGSHGTGFMAEVCQEWEAATEPANKKGIRVVNFRIGIILSTEGGALKKMLLLFKMGLGGIIGSGKQYWSWISFDDVMHAIAHVLVTDSLNGPVNVVAPVPVTNREFTKTLGRVLWRPTLFQIPTLPVQLAFGEMADELILASTRVVPTKLIESGYTFRRPELKDAFRYLLGKTNKYDLD